MTDDPQELMRSIIERIATGPEMSKNISADEACRGMLAVLDGKVDDVQAALFLIALRMKRETDDENLGLFRALLEHSPTATADVDELMTLADPFNGFNRGLPMSPFLPPVLAACGLPCLSTGVETVAPKFGLTHHHVLAAAGKSVTLSLGAAARQLADAGIGWAYVDQAVASPGLHGLRGLRRQMVKRPALSTCEVIMKPLTARRRNLALVGYVHANYPRVYAMLAHAAGFDAAVIVKGAEGGVVPSLQASSKLFLAEAGEAGEPISLNPELVGIEDAPARAIPAPADDPAGNAPHALEHGLAALDGAAGAARDSLVYAGAIALFGAGRAQSLAAGAEAVRRVLDSGEALARFRGAG